ncbi:hypothetical protein ACFVT2_18165 [Streptomyces sp. NPDC058000]|uniref:hypothetical protein n=1 Tax=Streptomyces sp. NPDC058000 TaxID=3346299 RepID=UPI0036E35C14
MGRKAAARRRHRTAPTGNGNPGRAGKPGRIDESGQPGRISEPEQPEQPGRTGKPGITGISGGSGQPPGAADGSGRAHAVPGGRLPPHQEPKPKRPVRTIRVPGLFG